MVDDGCIDLPIDITYTNKRTSSGRIFAGHIVLTIGLKLSKDAQRSHIRQLTDALTARAQKLMAVSLPQGEVITDQQQLEHIADRINDAYYQQTYSSISFRKQDSRWGSCSLATRKIYISRRLVGAPIELVEYVVAHELAHLIQPDHSVKFWKLVSKACPQYKKRRVQIEAWSLSRDLNL